MGAIEAPVGTRSVMGILFGCLLTFGASLVLASAAGNASDSNGGDWVYVDHDLAGTRYSPLQQINTKNVSQLVKACAYSFPDKEPSQTAPIVSAGRMYLTTAHYTVAVDGADCHVIWSSTWAPREHEPTNTHRGAALAAGRIIRGTDDGFLLALDAKDGHTLWSRQIADPKEGYFLSMAPLVHGNLVYIGPAGAETAAQGWVGAFRISDGKQVWRFNIVPNDGEPGADTWGPDPAARRHGGGNLWTPMSFDVQRNLLYVPGGNAAPDLYDDDRPGDNLYTNSLIALNATTGHLVWYRQFVPHDVHDYDVSHVAPVFKTTINGSARNVIASTGKDGLLRLLDRDSREIIYSVPFTNRVHADAPITTTPLRVCPGTLGGQEWNGSAYFARQNLLIVPATDWCAQFNKDKTAPDPQKEHTHAFYFGGETNFDPWSAARGRLTAFDASTGHEKWRYDAAKPMVGGVTATAGDVIFAGELTGDLLALDARTGKVLLRRDLGGPAGGGVVTYSAGGRQNVAVVSGFVGVYNLVAPEIGGGNTTVTVFRLSNGE
ncbi:MAG TPA: PQQ-binding-like beta-propeller repeat protein [Steroidobacteraceae bacterium]|nr:PQQ-binding-like beta-propeller repeat protein [Steroidobacteraceae bacterium]